MAKQTTKALYDAFDPRAYLLQFYSNSEVSHDEELNLKEALRWLHKNGRVFERAIEVGCGPTIHHAVPFANYVKELHLSDYSAANRMAVSDWLRGVPSAHSWQPYLQGCLKLEGIDATPEAVQYRSDQLRRLVKSVRHCDVFRDPCIDDEEGFDLVTSFYTAECAAGARDRWEEAMTRVLSLVRPSGALFMTAMRNSTWYDVLGRRFPVASINEDDFRELLPRHGFSLARAEIEAVRVHGWENEGFDGIVLVRGFRDK